MNEQYTTMNIPAMMTRGHSNDSVSSADIQSLLRGKSFGHQKQQEDKPFEMNPTIPDYNDADMQELQDYCTKRGILGVNFNGRDPKSILKMLKARMGDRTSINETKRGLLNG
jgi:hypothetical protein